MTLRLFLGFDPSEMCAYNVADRTARKHGARHIDRIALRRLTQQGLYRRPTGLTDHGYWDEISGAPMSTGHAIARFLVPALCGYEGWALFTDGDVLFRRDLSALTALADETKAVQVVQHLYQPAATVKMEGAIQTQYARKNWSSVMLLNCGHPANQALTVDLVNTVPGRDLHRFCWLEDDLIGALPADWNYLVGHGEPPADPAIVHFTEGLPNMPGYEFVPFADEWYAAAAAAGYRLERPESIV